MEPVQAVDLFLPNDVELAVITRSSSPEAGLLALELARLTPPLACIERVQ